MLLFLPAFDEEQAIADLLRRVPATAAGRRLELVVVDDGSQDATAAIARGMGVEVLSLGANRGLGAAVRRSATRGPAGRCGGRVLRRRW